MPKDKEVELKYVIPDEKMLDKIKKDAMRLKFPGLAASWFSGPLNRNDVYFDTKELHLLRTGRCFRFGGKSGQEARITFKEETARQEERIEIEDVLETRDALAALRTDFPSRAVSAMRKVVGSRQIYPVLRVYKMFYRIIINTCEVVFGHTVYAGPAGAVERLDLEIEEKLERSPGASKQVEAILAPRYNLVKDMRSKYKTGMALVGGVK